jgi:hypothetical protein
MFFPPTQGNSCVESFYEEDSVFLAVKTLKYMIHLAKDETVLVISQQILKFQENLEFSRRDSLFFVS